MSRLFLPAATNYVKNPSLELDTNADGIPDGWGIGGSQTGSLTITRVPSITGRGQWATRVQYTANEGDTGKGINFYYDSGPCVIPVGSVTFSIYAQNRCVVANAETNPVFFANREDWSGLVANDLGHGVSETTRYSTTENNLAEATSFFFQFTCTGLTPGDVIDYTFDDIQLESSPVATPYFDGASTDSLNENTYAWTGAANASTSTRAVSALTFPIGTCYGATGIGTVAARVVPLFDKAVTAASSVLCIGSGSNRYYLIWGGATKWSTSEYDGTNSPSAESAAQTFAAGSVHSLVSRHSGTTIDLMTDGTAATQVADNATIAGLANIQLGHAALIAAGWSARSYLGPVLISPQRKSDAWTTAMDALLRTDAPDITRIKRDFMAPGDALFTGLEVNGSHLYTKGS